MILENLKIAGVQQAHKEDRINLTALTPWPGDLVCADGRLFLFIARECDWVHHLAQSPLSKVRHSDIDLAPRGERWHRNQPAGSCHGAYNYLKSAGYC
jgi:hypothetical protein